MKKILIIRFRRVGDSVISSTICSSLKRSIPDSEIHYVLNEGIAPLFEHHPDIDKVIPFSKEELDSFSRYRRKVKRLMKENKYDIIIDARATPKTMLFPLFSMRTKYRIGQKKWYSVLYNHKIRNIYEQVEPRRDQTSLAMMYLDPLREEFSVVEDPVMKLYCTPEEKAGFRRYMESEGVDFNKPVIVCSAAVRLDHKAWPDDRMAEVLNMILDKCDAQLILNWGDAKEKEKSEAIREKIGRGDRVFTNIEARSLRELVAMLSNSSFFFGNEGGVRHISQALNVPSFAIFPPDVEINNWLPNRSDRFQGIEPADIDSHKAADQSLAYGERLRLIDVDSVWSRLAPMLDKYL